jgi:hypothetical protein
VTFGRKLPLIICVTTLVVLVLPALAWLSSAPSVTRMAAVELVLSLFLGAYGGSGAAVMADLFPVGVRASGLTISYNVGAAPGLKLTRTRSRTLLQSL